MSKKDKVVLWSQPYDEKFLSMSSKRSSLYLCLDPDSMKIMCQYLHPKFYEFFFGRHDKLTKEDKVWFIKEYLHESLLEQVWSELQYREKYNLSNELFFISVKKHSFLIIQWLTNKKKCCPIKAINLAKKLKYYDMIPYLKSSNAGRDLNIYQKNKSRSKAKQLFY